VGVKEQDIPRIVADTLKSPQMPMNPRAATAEELADFYKRYL
jgi:alcohol dehydrogenase class IV